MKRKQSNTTINLPPIKPLFDKEKIIKEINEELNKRGDKIVLRLLDIKDLRRTWISYEFNATLQYSVIGENKPTKVDGCIYWDWENVKTKTLFYMSNYQKWRNE